MALGYDRGVDAPIELPEGDMERKRAILGIGMALAAVVMTCGSGARIHIALEDKDDPAPRRVEAGVQLASLCLSFILSWSQDQAKPAAGALY